MLSGGGHLDSVRRSLTAWVVWGQWLSVKSALIHWMQESRLSVIYGQNAASWLPGWFWWQ